MMSSKIKLGTFSSKAEKNDFASLKIKTSYQEFFNAI